MRAYFAQVFVRDAASAERMLFLALIVATLLNFSVAPLMGYFGVARRPKPLRFALPYPWGGLVWQWALHWLVAGALYLAVGLASGVWVAPAKWLFWTTYFWVAFVLLPSGNSGVAVGVLLGVPNAPARRLHRGLLCEHARHARLLGQHRPQERGGCA
jgi:hypothetical protein